MEFDYALFRQFTVMANKPFYRLIFNSLRGVYHKIGLLFFSEENIAKSRMISMLNCAIFVKVANPI